MTHPTQTQTEAERLADAINLGWLENVDPEKADVPMIQGELRRLSAENEQLKSLVGHLALPVGHELVPTREVATLRERVAQLEAERDHAQLAARAEAKLADEAMAERVPMTPEQVRAALVAADVAPSDDYESIFEEGVKAAERAHGITQGEVK